MPGRHCVGRCVVVQGILDAIERLVADPIRQGLAPAPDSSWVLALPLDIVFRALAFDRDPVDVQQAVDHLNPVAGKTNYALDVVDRVIPGKAEHRDVAALGLRSENAPGEHRRREWQRIMRISVSISRNEQVIANQQRRFHRPRRNAEGLEQQSSNDRRDDQRGCHRADGFHQSAVPALFLARHSC